MESVEYNNVISEEDIKKFPISITTTEVNLTGSWRFSKPNFEEKISPCSVGCPANTNIPKYIFHLLKNDIKTAANILRDENPFPAVCGRVCPHFCQEKCNRKEYDGSVEIREIEKFVGDYALDIPYEKAQLKTNKRVAVIGGGPAGLSCAYFLAKNGYKVTIYEKENFLGGLLIYGIPSYRLPREIAEKEINNIIDMGNIEVKLNETVSFDRLQEFKNSYNAVFFAGGLSKDRIPDNIEMDNEKVFSGYELLKKLNTDKSFAQKLKGEKIAVVGGGNVAFDVARTVLRLGNEVEIIYRRTLQEAPSFEEEKAEGLDEGLKITEKSVVTNIVKSKKLNLTLGKVDKIVNGDAQLTGETENIEVDKLVIATGQAKEFEIEKDDKIFLGGDYEHGAKTVIEAIASGKTNAYKIMAHLENKPFYFMNEQDNFLRSKRDFDSYKVVDFKKINLFYFDKQPPLKINKLSAEDRVKDFKEVALKPTLDKILNEAKRCFSCGVCNECKTCWFFCPDVCINVKDGVDFDYTYCKGCGLCSAECPRGVIDMVEDK